MCLVCDRIKMIQEGRNPYFVKELKTGYVVIGDHQHFKGYCLFLCKIHETELHRLPGEFKKKYLEEMSLVGEAAYRAFAPDKMNYELLGNGDVHLHWHIFPRVAGDTPVKGPVWWLPYEEMYSKENEPSLEELEELKQRLLTELTQVLAENGECEQE